VRFFVEDCVFVAVDCGIEACGGWLVGCCWGGEDGETYELRRCVGGFGRGRRLIPRFRNLMSCLGRC
jgi:hypothetical protein